MFNTHEFWIVFFISGIVTAGVILLLAPKFMVWQHKRMKAAFDKMEQKNER